MKKIVLAFLLLFIIKNASYGQAYYDALKLKSYYSGATKKIPLDNSTVPILKKYFKVDTLKAEITNKNLFLKNLFISAGSANSNAALLPAAISSLGNTNVSSLANGVTAFLIKRAKEELFISIINKLQDSTKFPEFVILFPNTRTLMKSFNSWEYSNALNSLKAAFEKDLQQLLGDIPKLSTLKPKDYTGSVYTRVYAITEFLNKPAARIYISAMQIGNGIIVGEKMPDIIDIIAGEHYLGNIPGANPDVESMIKFLNIISYSLRNKLSGKNYISAGEFKSVVTDTVFQKLYLGLIYQQILNEKIQFSNIKFTDIAGILISQGTVTYIDSLISQGEALNTSMAALSAAKKKGEKDLSTYWASIFESANQFLQSAEDVSVINSSLALPPELQKTLNYGANTLEIAHDIALQNYSGAIVDLNSFIPFTKDDSVFKAFFVKYGSFAANLVQAQNATDAENAIEAVALPVGSYSIKQNSFFNISLNGYVGYAFDINNHFTKLYAQGIYAPIGFSFNWGTRCFISNISGFASAFDLGSLVSYQLSNPATATSSSSNNQTTTTSTASPEIKLASIFSPSAQLLFEIKGTPFAFGGGWRRTPTLYYSSGTNYSTVGSRSVFTANLLIDIPILTLHNVPFKK